jgi:hypothetical protein
MESPCYPTTLKTRTKTVDSTSGFYTTGRNHYAKAWRSIEIKPLRTKFKKHSRPDFVKAGMPDHGKCSRNQVTMFSYDEWREHQTRRFRSILNLACGSIPAISLQSPIAKTCNRKNTQEIERTIRSYPIPFALDWMAGAHPML